jgi:hypothetical protein
MYIASCNMEKTHHFATQCIRVCMILTMNVYYTRTTGLQNWKEVCSTEERNSTFYAILTELSLPRLKTALQ